ncbi:MAG: tripartite tricarboxylate transporter substrate binding protein [Burkholderiales bacterium]|nr:tripartite tricarboxylate transporter substrate binding protein [Burkholderiales bacterium]
MTHLIRACLAALLLTTAAGASLAQAQYPNKPIRFIVPFPPGGGTDIVARAITNRLSENLGVQIIVDNRGGAGGTLGIAAAATAAPDGYTLMIGQTSNLAIGPALYEKLPYDTFRDFTPISMVYEAPLAVTVSSRSTIKSVKELIAVSKSKQGGLNFASPGNGTVAHLTGELIKKTTGMSFVHIPYKGAAQAIPDLIAGRADFYISSLESAKPHMQSGTIRALAVTSVKRAPDAPEIETIAEAGYKGFEAVTWWGILAPAKTPAPIINRLAAEIGKVLDHPEVTKRLPGPKADTSPAFFAEKLKIDHKKWAQAVKESGAKVN